MEVISIIVMFLFGNMSDTEDRLTQYIPMENLSSCLKEKRILARNKEFKKDAFCGEAIVEIEDGKVIKLYNEIPDGAVLVKKKVTKEALKENNPTEEQTKLTEKFDLDFKLKLIDDFEKEYVDTKLISKEHLKSQINSWF